VRRPRLGRPAIATPAVLPARLPRGGASPAVDGGDDGRVTNRRVSRGGRLARLPDADLLPRRAPASLAAGRSGPDLARVLTAPRSCRGEIFRFACSVRVVVCLGRRLRA